MEVAGAVFTVENCDAFLARLRKLQAEVQAFDADYVVGKLHLVSARERAVRAMAEGRAKCDKVELETLCYAAGERQISGALAKLGIKDSTARIALLGDAEAVERALREIGAKRDDSVLEPSEEKLARLGIAGTADPDAVFELMSMREVDS